MLIPLLLPGLVTGEGIATGQSSRLAEPAPASRTAADAFSHETLARARTALAEGALPEAEQLVRETMARRGETAESLYLLGEVLMRRDQPQASLPVFTRAAALSAPSGAELRLVALDYALLKDYPDAIRWLQRAAQMAPGDAEIWYSLGRAQYSQGDFPGAADSFRRTLSLDPASVKAEDNLGLACTAENQPRQALDAFRAAVALQKADASGTNPGGTPQRSEQPLLDLGQALLRAGRAPDAIDPLSESVRLAPLCAECHESLGRALADSSRTAAAIHAMETAVALAPRNPRYHFELSRLYRQTGDIARARAEAARSDALYGTHSTSPEQ